MAFESKVICREASLRLREMASSGSIHTSKNQRIPWSIISLAESTLVSQAKKQILRGKKFFSHVRSLSATVSRDGSQSLRGSAVKTLQRTNKKQHSSQGSSSGMPGRTNGPT